MELLIQTKKQLIDMKKTINLKASKHNSFIKNQDAKFQMIVLSYENNIVDRLFEYANKSILHGPFELMKFFEKVDIEFERAMMELRENLGQGHDAVLFEVIYKTIKNALVYNNFN